MEKEVIYKILKDNINVTGLVIDSLDQILEPALKKVVDDSSNVFDDMLYASVYPILKKELKEQIEKLVNGLLKTDE